MAIYILQDMQASDDGDLILDDHGDFKLASPLRTTTQAINTTILTNKGDIITDPLYGANLISFYGDTNNEQTHALMESTLKEALRIQSLVHISDIDIDVVPIDTDQAAVLVDLKGTFADTEDTTGAVLRPLPMDNGVSLGYIYPFTSGLISVIS